MNRREGRMPDLKVELSPPRVPLRGSPSGSLTSLPSSCVSAESNLQDDQSLKYSSSPEATSMILVGCPRCLMYVMVAEEDPKCPKCKSGVLLDFSNDGINSLGRNKNKDNGDNNEDDHGASKMKKT